MVIIPLRFSIVGPPGAGKSTLLSELEKRFKEPVNYFALPFNTHIGIVEEPVEKFKTSPLGKYNMLDNYYKNPKQFAQPFQYYCLLEQANAAKKMIKKMTLKSMAMDKLIVIEDRSLECCDNFASYLCHEQHYLSPIEYEILQSMLSYFVKDVWGSAHRIMIYLQTPTNIAYNRMMLRQRKEETAHFQFNDFEKLSNYFLDDVQNEIASGNEDVYVIDGSKTMGECADEAEAVILRYINLMKQNDNFKCFL